MHKLMYSLKTSQEEKVGVETREQRNACRATTFNIFSVTFHSNLF